MHAMKMKRAIALALCAGAFLWGATLPGAAQEVVRAGSLGISADGPVFIAIEKGYFRAEGIEVKLEQFAGGAQAMAPLSAGQLDVFPSSGVASSLFNAFARGWPVRIVGTNSVDIYGVDVLLARSDLKPEIRRIADLKGRKVATNTAGSPLLYMLGKMLESDGLSMKDVEIVYLQFPDMGTAFRNKAIDAATQVEPFSTLFQEQGIAFRLAGSDEALRNPLFQVAVVLYNSAWADRHPAAAQGFMNAYIRGSRDYVEASRGGRTRAEVIDILVKHTRIKDKALYERMRWNYPDPNGVILKDSLRDQQDWHAQQGGVPKKVDIDAIVDEQYVRRAVQKLGVHK
jgi:NitT/TauT family transport system substrate-binding protein